MTKLRFSGKLQIEDIRKHSEETIAKLRRLLTDGATAQADPRRKDFYEVENGRVVYYIHVPVPSKKGCSNRPQAKKAARPPTLSTRNISVSAASTSAKNIIPHRQVTRSKQESEKGN